MLFEATGIDKKLSSEKTLQIEAHSESEAEALAEKQGLTVLFVRPQGPRKKAQPQPGGGEHAEAASPLKPLYTQREASAGMRPACLFSTGDIPFSYDIIDIVFACGDSTQGIFKDVEPIQAYQIVTRLLGHTARQRGADAVINIRFDFRVAASQGLLGTYQAFEVYGYGTAVRIRNDVPGGRP